MRIFLSVVFSAALIGCPGSIDPIGPPASDTGAAASDSGNSAALDSGSTSPSDSGPTHVTDSGIHPVADTGVLPAMDAGVTPTVDAGITPAADAGLIAQDAGLPAGVCGTRGGVPNCGAGAFCNFPEANNCGRTDQGGQCDWVPEACGEIFAPVCGCDGNTYSNPCEAFSHSVSVDYQGECDAPPAPGGESCGPPRQPVMCTDGHYCDRPVGTCPVGRVSTGGSCTLRPRMCTRELNRVCGCDNVDYSNPCLANRAGTSVRSMGRCP
ncbi:MAG: Kazal-type serine protease inhibitor domain-containing protein [Myxococcota bacterium]|nr:Kazal-type serine protease inhibitor domain-containing protein [Myxococcota bacterium]